MKKTLLSFGASLMFLSGLSQTQLFFEDFESAPYSLTLNTSDQGGVIGTSGDNYWIINNVFTGGSGTVMFCAQALGQSFTVGNTPVQPVGITNANGYYMHIIAEEAEANGILNSNYGFAEGVYCIFAASHFASMSSDINTSNFTGVTLDFWWLNNASPATVGQIWYSTDGGSTWTQKTGTTYQGVSSWTNTTLTDPAWDGQSQLRFGFRLNNTQSFTSNDPGFSIDDIKVYGTLVNPCSPTSNTITQSACFSYTVPSGDETYITPGTMTVMDTILNVSGCDSVITINLTINDVDTSVTASASMLTSNASGAVYQWLDCNNSYAIITGATNASYSATGNFAVEVTTNGCVDTSSCHTLTLSIDELKSGDFKVFPNPSEGDFSVDLSGLSGLQILTILDTKGAIVYYDNITAGSLLNFNLRLEKGIYVVKLSDQYGMIRRSKLVIQ